MGIAVIKNVVDDPSKEFIDIEDSVYKYCFKDVEENTYCRMLSELKYDGLIQKSEYNKGRLFYLVNTDSNAVYYVSDIKEGMDVVLISDFAERFEHIALATTAVNKSVENGMLLLGYPNFTRITDKDFDGDISKIKYENKLGHIFNELKNINIRRNNEIVLSCKSLDSYYFNYSKELPWYASENAKITDVIRLAKETKLIKVFTRNLNEDPEEPTYDISNDVHPKAN